VTSDPEVVAAGDRIVLPGDGAFPACKAALDAVPGLAALDEAVKVRRGAVPGHLRGHADAGDDGAGIPRRPGLRLDPGRRCGGSPRTTALKVPHMGWNDLVIDRPHPVLEGIATGDHAYFVHSWQVGRPGRASAGACRLWRAGHGHRRARQHRRHAVPPRKEPGSRAAADRELPALAALTQLLGANRSIMAKVRQRLLPLRPGPHRPKSSEYRRAARGIVAKRQDGTMLKTILAAAAICG
jgi:hypothetical protein